MQIIQITDLHIAELGSPTILNIDVWGKFKRVLKEVKKLQPDLLVVSGDLCYNVENLSIYHWIKKELDQSGIPYQVIAGNHDNSGMIAQVFGLPLQEKTGESYYSKQYDAGKILFLDSAKAVFSDNQWSWLKTELATEQPTMIFMHHPPALAQTPFMDNHYSFKEMGKFAKVLETAQHGLQKLRFLPIFCGHYHLEKYIQTDSFHVFITPSTMAQIDGSNPKYTISHLTPAYRTINWNGKQVISGVTFLWD